MPLQDIGILLALLSALTTSAAHAVLKSAHDKLAIRGAVGLFGTTTVWPLAVFAPLPTPGMIPWLLAASGLHTTYQLVLIKSYRANDFAVAYPVARGMAPIATCLLGLVFLADPISPQAIVGAATVSCGLLWIARSQAISASGLAAALLAGLLTTAYTVVDAHAVRIAPTALTFVAWYFILDGLLMAPFLVLGRGRAVWRSLRAEGRRGLGGGLMNVISFGSALLALRLAPIGVVSALRETSVVVGLLLARYALGERMDRRRMAGALVVAAGAVLIVAAGHEPRPGDGRVALTVSPPAVASPRPQPIRSPRNTNEHRTIVQLRRLAAIVAR